MKPIYITLFSIFFAFSLQAQDLNLAVGKTTVDGDAIMDFGDELRGMVIAPIQDAETSSPDAGTIAFDGATGSFRFYNGTNWSNPQSGGATGGHASGTDTFKQIIGAETSATTGVVVFGEDNNESQALVLPKLENGNLRFNNPVAGLIYYDTALKSVMVYNGNAWTSF